MYWLVRGAVAVTSRDGEATYAELKPGAFFGEIGILMSVPRTATIIARTKCLLVVLKKEDLQAELPNFPEMERRIREEAQERLTILNKKRQERGKGPKGQSEIFPTRGPNIAREPAPGEVTTGDKGSFEKGTVINHKKRKSPSPGLSMENPQAGGSALGSGFVNVRKTLTDLPLFSRLPPDILHFLGLSAQPRTYPPFTDIIKQGSPGNEIYFIIRGEVEVIRDDGNEHQQQRKTRSSNIRPRLKQGQYFGEVASLSLAPRRTATVRSITSVECLMISGEVLKELWRRCPADVRDQVEATAKMRIGKSNDGDVLMTDADSTPPAIHDLEIGDRGIPRVTLTPSHPPSLQHKPSRAEDQELIEPLDPDPFLSVNMDEMRARAGRRSSWAPPPPDGSQTPLTSPKLHSSFGAASPNNITKVTHMTTPPDAEQFRLKRPRTVQRRPSEFSRGHLTDGILVQIFSHLDVSHLMRLRQVSVHWQRLLTLSPTICKSLDLSIINRFVTDKALSEYICPFVGKRARYIDISNCFHITDEGFNVLSTQCGQNVQVWKMKSVWDITANAVLEMANCSKQLEEIDLSNCRKVSDNLLARVVGWVVTQTNPRAKNGQDVHNIGPPVGTVVGCPKLKRLTLSYCKHVTDRSMAHLAVHAHDRLQSMDLTRCTTITDAGFQHWSIYKFSKLEKLILADCTYLTDNAIVYLTNAAKGLKVLDLVSSPILSSCHVLIKVSLFAALYQTQQQKF